MSYLTAEQESTHTFTKNGPYHYSIGWNDIDTTTLGIHAYLGYDEYVQKAITAGIDWSVESTTPIFSALDGKEYNIAKQLLTAGSPVDSEVFSRSLGSPVFDELFANHALSSYDSEALSSIMIRVCKAAHYDQSYYKYISWALEQGADIDTVDFLYGFPGWTGLHHASRYCDEALISFLLQNGADINRQTDEAATPILLCMSSPQSKVTRKQRRGCVRLLASRGATLSADLSWFDRFMAQLGFYVPYKLQRLERW